MDISALSDLYRSYVGADAQGMEKFDRSGSWRQYFRLWRNSDNGDKIDVYIGVIGDDPKECRAFVRLAELFEKSGVNVPRVFAASPDYMVYLQEDLGNESLFSVLKSEDVSDSEREQLLRASIDQLIKFHSVNPKEWEPLAEYPPFSRRQVMWDLNYFKYEYVKPSGIGFVEDALEDDFERFAAVILNEAEGLQGFMIRDFQSRNILIKNGETYVIDFQSGRRGPCLYDVVSLLWQAKADLDCQLKIRMLDYYAEKITESRKDSKLNIDKIHESARNFVLFRTLQVLGAYGLRGLIEKKSHFIESIPYALKNLKELLNSGVLDAYPELKAVSRKVVSDSRFKTDTHEGLKVSVFSFSYKKGYPEDYSGNGGGFMFDCRGMHNPGRYERYKQLTGRDPEVIEFLEENGEVQEFVNKALDIVSPSIKTYFRRGFTSLQIGFGCTGGRHRSVYCADRLSRLLSAQFPDVKIEVRHLEQNF